jgi:hypothetical protein
MTLVCKLTVPLVNPYCVHETVHAVCMNCRQYAKCKVKPCRVLGDNFSNRTVQRRVGIVPVMPHQ